MDANVLMLVIANPTPVSTSIGAIRDANHNYRLRQKRSIPRALGESDRVRRRRACAHTTMLSMEINLTRRIALFIDLFLLIHTFVNKLLMSYNRNRSKSNAANMSL